MNYKDVDFSKWQSVPSEDVYKDWKTIRDKMKAPITQTAINRLSCHVNKLAQHGVDSDEAIAITVEKGWRAFKFAWVMNEISKDMDAMSMPVIAPQTKDLTAQEVATDRSWIGDE